MPCLSCSATDGPPYATAEQYERWFIRDCARCGRRRNYAARWPDGHVCRTCHDRALRTRGRCPGCAQDRVLPGLIGDDPVCSGCAGFTTSYACARCGQESKLHRGRLCSRCALHDRLGELLDDGTGQVRPELLPLRDALTATANPRTGLTWLYNTGPAALLRLRPRRHRTDPRGIPRTPALAGGRAPARAADDLRRAP